MATLDALSAPAYGAALPPLSDRRLSRFAAADWSPEVADLLRAENRQIELAVLEALAARCSYATDYATAIAQGASALADRDIISHGYRSSQEIALLRRAARERTQADLRLTSDTDCAAQEHRLEDALAQVQSELRPQNDEADETPATAPAVLRLHAQILSLSRLQFTASRCAVPEATVAALEGLHQRLDKQAAIAGVLAQDRLAWVNQGSTFGEYAFSTWPGVACDVLRKSLAAQTPMLLRAASL